jgi:predicted nucleic acid-binding protein
MILSATTDYLFDTTVFIDYLRNRNGVKQIMNERKTLIAGDVYYSAVTEFESWLGIQG